MEGLFKDRLSFIDLKLGLEIGDVVGEGGAVGTTTGVGERKALVHYLIAKTPPVTLATTVLLDLLGVDIGIAVLGEEARKVVDRRGGAFSDALVVAVVGLVRSGHLELRYSGGVNPI